MTAAADLPTKLAEVGVSAAIVTAAVSFSLFVLKQIYDEIREALLRRDEYRKMVRSLYAEIRYNTGDLETFLDRAISLKALRRATQEAHDAKRPFRFR